MRYPIWIEASLCRSHFVCAAILIVLICVPKCLAEDGEAKPSMKVIVKYNIAYVSEGANGSPSSSAHVADLYMPSDAGRYPGIVMIHGGAWVAGDKSNDAVHARKVAAKGYVVMVINYRLAPAHKYPAQLDDCFDAIRWLVNHADEYHVDGDRIGVWGYSAGGHLAALVATNPRSGVPRVKACVVGGAPCDLRLVPAESSLLSGFLGGTRKEIPEVYASASPVEHVTEDDPPMFLFHGQADRLVPIQFSEGMLRRLEETNVTHQYLPLANKSHIMGFVDKEALNQAIDFFEHHLKQGLDSEASQSSAAALKAP